jgi:tetratricopeptide (TPR) repeat protein
VIEPCLLNPESRTRALLEWAACLLEDGELDRLRPLFERPTDALRGIGAFWLLHGEWARRQGLEAEALDNYREAIRLDPRSADAHYRLGLALRQTGPEATRCLEVAQKARDLKNLVAQISDRSRDTERLVRAGRLCADIGRYREARAWFSVALKSNPRHAEARACLETLDAEQATWRGNGKKAHRGRSTL